MNFFRKIVEGKLIQMGFKLISSGRDGILAKRISTGKFIGVTFSGDPFKLWTKLKLHPFSALIKKNELVFRDELNGDLVKYI